MMNRVLGGFLVGKGCFGNFVSVRGVLETSAISILARLLFENRYLFFGGVGSGRKNPELAG